MRAKGEIPHIRYTFDRETHIKYRRLMKTLDNSLKFESSDVAKFRLHVIEHAQRYGVRSALSAFKVKKSTYYTWRKKYVDSGKKLYSLVPDSTRPTRVRDMEVDKQLVIFIRRLRHKYGNVGARILKPFVDAYAFEIGEEPIGRTTIEKVIRRYKLTFEKRIKVKRKTKYAKLRTRKSPKINKPGYIEADTIEIRIFGTTYYFLSVIDIYTRYAQVYVINRRASKYTKDCLRLFQEISPHKIHTVQTDNGSEFMKMFHRYLEEKKLKHVFIYPNSPKINGVVERFNRTIQEEFINRSPDFGIDQQRFNTKLSNYLNWYNTKRPHSALGYQSPTQFINQRV